MASRGLWEILVPVRWNNGKKISIRTHRRWDTQVRIISGGLTVLKTTRGQWVNPRGELSHERMIPVRIIASRREIEQIIGLTLDFYRQEAVLAYKLSDQVLLVHKNG